MIKKLALVAVALAFAVPAFAHREPPKPPTTLTIRNHADVDTKTFTVANTGFNEFGPVGPTGLTLGGHEGRSQSGDIKTGDAAAYADVLVGVNSNTVNGCGCYDNVTIKNRADVDTFTLTMANSGFNTGGRGDITTGDALASSVVTAVVNTNVVGK